MMLFGALLSVLLTSLHSVRAQYPAPGACSGDCFTHDPAVVKRADGKYFRFSTLDLIGIWTADNLAGPWTRSGSVIQGASIINIPGNDVLWAPDVVYMRGMYYCFYSVSVSSSQTSAIGYAVSTTMESGSWSDQGAVVTSTSSSPYNAIDSNVVNGTAEDEFYIQWGSYWNNIYQARVAIDGEYVFRSGNEHQIAYEPSGNHQEEGAFIWKRDTTWYLFLSKGICCTYDPATDPIDQVYHIAVCKSDSPAGPFVDKDGVACTDGGGTTVLASQGNTYAPGGQGVFTDDAYGDVLYYHYLDLTVGVDYNDSKFGWNVITWVDGWPTVS
ncbi:glycoside hydrolase family 43 protein [Annulohypoxylon truncatum]|uniref:glycoside hydrolase family 43 protein n=1 Tax=Annulohypoxylon truncatum TaxID=327061 RepID=UPI002008828C|nr:glycoside hydrolase family 43 protein [Annulohypoxylon truncatum]KAI1210784.1 glycoside hydrolase family 43 protein [Annulohypoxylon truncatum]